MKIFFSPKFRSIAFLVLASVMALTLWFSTTAVVPSLIKSYDLDGYRVAMFTSTVQVGFVLGTLLSAFFGVADRMDPRRLFIMATLIAAAANATLLVIDPRADTVFVFRFIVGMCMAGVYPIGMKLAATWADRDLGFLVGIVVGALVLGSATPHLFNALGGIDWRFSIGAGSIAAIIGALFATGIQIGPKKTQSPPFKPQAALTAFYYPPLRLTNCGYLGHMWELYAMWAWLGVFLDTSFQLSGAGNDPAFWAKVSTFLVIGVGGAIGCVGGGLLADRCGRTILTAGAMAISSSCAVLVGLLFGAPPLFLTAFCFIWGITVVADSAQFSSSITELAPPERIGTMLTVQTCSGFMLTLIPVHLIPYIAEAIGWRYAFCILALGPAIGVICMLKLRYHPDAKKLANGKK